MIHRLRQIAIALAQRPMTNELASEAEDALALLPAAGEPAVGAPDGASDPSRDILLRADPSATVAFYPLPDGTSGQCLGRSWSGSKRVPKTKR